MYTVVQKNAPILADYNYDPVPVPSYPMGPAGPGPGPPSLRGPQTADALFFFHLVKQA